MSNLRRRLSETDYISSATNAARKVKVGPFANMVV